MSRITRGINVGSERVSHGSRATTSLTIGTTRHLFGRRGVSQEEVSCLLFYPRSPSCMLPASTYLVRGHLKLSGRVNTLSFGLKYSNFICNLSLTRKLVTTKVTRGILLLATRACAGCLRPLSGKGHAVFNSNTTTALVSASNFTRVNNFILNASNQNTSSLVIGGNNTHRPNVVNSLAFSRRGDPVSSSCLCVSNKSVFRFALVHIPGVMGRLLRGGGTTFRGISLFMFRRTGECVVSFVQRGVKVRRSGFCCYLRGINGGISSAVPVTLCRTRRRKHLRKGVVLTKFKINLS